MQILLFWYWRLLCGHKMWRVDEIQWSVDSPVIKPRWERKKRQSNTKQSSSLAQENSKEEGRVLPPISLFTKTVNLTRNNPMSTGRWWRHRRVPIGLFLGMLVTLGWMTFLHYKTGCWLLARATINTVANKEIQRDTLVLGSWVRCSFTKGPKRLPTVVVHRVPGSGTM